MLYLRVETCLMVSYPTALLSSEPTNKQTTTHSSLEYQALFSKVAQTNFLVSLWLYGAHIIKHKIIRGVKSLTEIIRCAGPRKEACRCNGTFDIQSTQNAIQPIPSLPSVFEGAG